MFPYAPCPFAPGLSEPYLSKRLTIPQTPNPAPSAVTSVCKVLTDVEKNCNAHTSFKINLSNTLIYQVFTVIYILTGQRFVV